MTSESKLQQIFHWTSLRKNWRLQTRKIVKSIKYVPSTGKTNIYNFHVSDVAKQVQRQAKIIHPSMQQQMKVL